MHELSIALSMIEIATEEAERRGALRVTALYLKLGPLSGVVKDALLFSYEVASSGTPLEGSRLVIEDTAVVVYCSECQAQRQLESIQRFCCPVCDALCPDVVTGRELEFVAMEIEEQEEAAAQREIAEREDPAEFTAVRDQLCQLEEVAR
ncbi:MAG TPA: hydrogenase maturation nickel metallochaperone HypA [Pyrinomonadaceae bacterium]|jgi:hydrogenase nickel incorporation protein HypA/HybF